MKQVFAPRIDDVCRCVCVCVNVVGGDDDDSAGVCGVQEKHSGITIAPMDRDGQGRQGNMRGPLLSLPSSINLRSAGRWVCWFGSSGDGDGGGGNPDQWLCRVIVLCGRWTPPPSCLILFGISGEEGNGSRSSHSPAWRRVTRLVDSRIAEGGMHARSLEKRFGVGRWGGRGSDAPAERHARPRHR